MKSKFKLEKLKVHEQALNFVDEVYDLTKHFSKDELYGLISQLKRVPTSIVLHIGEGHGTSNAQFNRHLIIAKRQGFILENQENSLI